jgi:hypothetical protein
MSFNIIILTRWRRLFIEKLAGQENPHFLLNPKVHTVFTKSCSFVGHSKVLLLMSEMTDLRPVTILEYCPFFALRVREFVILHTVPRDSCVH